MGCGASFLKDWLNTDWSATVCSHGGIYLNVAKKFPIPDNSFDYIFAEHLIEHLNFAQATLMLKECYRVLKPGGVLRLSTPNLTFLMDLYMHPDKPLNKAYIDYLAEQGHFPADPIYAISYFHTAWGHQIIYDPKSLRNLLTESGFIEIESCEIKNSKHIELQGIEQHNKRFLKKQQMQDFNKLQTMILEGSKPS